MNERSEDWLNAVVDYHTGQGYGKENNFTCCDGYIKCLIERKKRELDIPGNLTLDNYIFN